MNQNLPDTVVEPARREPGALAEVFRSKLRLAATMKNAGNLDAEREARDDADAIWRELERMIVRTLHRYACAQVSQSHPFYQDLMQDMRLDLLRQLSDLRPEQDIWQQKFGFCLQQMAIKIAPRSKKKYRLWDSLDEPVSIADADGPAKIDQMVDEENVSADQMVELKLRLSLIAKEVGEKQLEVFLLREYCGHTWPKIAALCAISEKTARNYHKAVTEFVQEE